ncbi:MAG: glycosyltransferase, partial [Phototrophicaceae bacterium]
YGDAVRLIQQANQGPALARNTGIEAATGAYIKFCDADDILYPRHIEKVMVCFAQNPAVAAVYTRYLHVLADGQTPKPHITDPDLLSGDIYCDLLASNSNAILTSALTVKRDCLLDIGLFLQDDTLRHSEDWDLFLRLAARYLYATVPEILVNYRWHDDNISSQNLSVALGRLIVWQRSRETALEKGCYTTSEFDRIIAGRYHLYAIQAWRWRQHQDARQAFQQAITLTPHSRLIRRLYWALTYIAPFRVVPYIDALLKKVQAS